MAVALNTTKRKFTRLLDSFTSPSTPHLSSANGDEPARKRLHVADATSTDRPVTAPYSSTLNISRSNISRPSSVRLVNTSEEQKNSPPRKTPNYAPWSQEQFLARLKSFSDVKRWTSKPDSLGEVEWAKRGWMLEGWNRVACKGGCEQRVSVRLRAPGKSLEGKEIENSEDGSGEIDEEIVERFAEMITTGHSEHCLWRRSGCKKDIYHIPMARRDFFERELLRRYDSLVAMASELPPAESLITPGEIPQKTLDLIPPTFFDKAETHSDEPNPMAASIATFGWTGLRQSGLPLLTCDYCFQRVGLWMYSAARISEMSEKLSVASSSLRLHLLETHREHCPWKNGESQHNPPEGSLQGLNAWETGSRTLMRLRIRGELRPTSQRSHVELLHEPPSPGGSAYSFEADARQSIERPIDPSDFHTRWKRLQARMTVKRVKK